MSGSSGLSYFRNQGLELNNEDNKHWRGRQRERTLHLKLRRIIRNVERESGGRVSRKLREERET